VDIVLPGIVAKLQVLCLRMARTTHAHLGVNDASAGRKLKAADWS